MANWPEAKSSAEEDLIARVNAAIERLTRQTALIVSRM